MSKYIQLVWCFVPLGTNAANGAYDFLENVIGFGGPDKGFRIPIMHGDVILDSAE